MSISIPPQLLVQKVEDKIVSRVVLDLTLYLVGPSLSELDYLINIYSRICPADKLTRYTITELQFWPLISNPVLTSSARIASQKGKNYSYFEPVRHRIEDGRAFDAQLWDGNEISESEGSWNFSCRRIHNHLTGLHAFVRFNLPIAADFKILHILANEIIDNVDVYSGHGGISFTYDPWLDGIAFDLIYAHAKRYWGLDIECLNVSLPLMKNAIKGISWITIIGNKLLEDNLKNHILDNVIKEPSIKLENRKKGLVFMMDDHPNILDTRNFQNTRLIPYFTLATILSSFYPKYHPDFPGKLFFENGNTLDWIRRFVDPKKWRG